MKDEQLSRHDKDNRRDGLGSQASPDVPQAEEERRKRQAIRTQVHERCLKMMCEHLIIFQGKKWCRYQAAECGKLGCPKRV